MLHAVYKMVLMVENGSVMYIQPLLRWFILREYKIIS